MKTVNANAIFPSSKQFETIIFNVYFIHIDAIFKILETRRYFGFYDIIVEQRNGIFIPSGRIAIWWTGRKANTDFISTLIKYNTGTELYGPDNISPFSKCIIRNIRKCTLGISFNILNIFHQLQIDSLINLFLLNFLSRISEKYKNLIALTEFGVKNGFEIC